MEFDIHDMVAQYGRVKVTKLLELEIELRRKNTPLQLHVPNIGQQRMLDLLARPKPPSVGAMFCGNGVGKTNLLVAILNAIAWRGRYSHPGYFKDLSHIWKTLKHPRIRIVCAADDMLEGGSLHTELVQWFPKGQYQLKKNGKSYYSSIEIDRKTAFTEEERKIMDPSDLKMSIDVKTHDQAITAHAGPNLDIILFNEPPGNEDIYDENISRLRNSAMPMALLFMTPLNVAPWLYERVEEAADGINVCTVKASIWDNCKDIAGTRGVLPKENIETMIREWKKRDPIEAAARENGEFKHLSGSIYKAYSDEVHMVEDFDEIPPHWMITAIVDPHDARPPAVNWYATAPNNMTYAIRQYPEVDNYHKLTSVTKRLDVIIDELHEIERTFFKGHTITRRFMDPNKGMTKTNQTEKTMQKAWADCGWSASTEVNDDLTFGHQRVRDLLYYDMEKEVDEFNQPRLKVCRGCTNLRQALKKYGYKDKMDSSGSMTSKVSPTYKDYGDNVRYFSVTFKGYEAPRHKLSEWNSIKAKRKNMNGRR